jgi:serine/threonine-protein phosphatase PGAM5
MTLRTLYLIRHGQYETGDPHRDGGSLTPLGNKQAQYVAKAFAQIPVHTIYASTMLRAVETANIIAKTIEMSYQTTELLREAIPSIPPRIAEQILALMKNDPNLTHESIHEERKRADAAFEHFFTAAAENAQPINELLVCHGNILRYLICRAIDINVDTWAKMNINHCGISSISIDSQGRMRLVTHNETRHLPIQYITD